MNFSLRLATIGVIFGLWVSSGANASFDPLSVFIIGGSQVSSDDPIYPSTVMVDAGLSFCSGTMVSPYLVVTAAHCVTGGAEHDVLLPLDAIRISFPGTHGPHGEVRFVHVTGFEVHPLWSQHASHEKNQADIALVRMAGMIPSLYHAANFWPGKAPLQIGSQVVIAGFGVSDVASYSGGGVLRKAEILAQEPDYGSSEVILDQSKGAGACYGDSGGPAFIMVNQKAYFWGLASRGDADCAHRIFYTRVEPYRDWLSQAASHLGAGPLP